MGIMELRDLPSHENISGHAEDFVQSMKEVDD
jgi:hypothetical protein